MHLNIYSKQFYDFVTFFRWDFRTEGHDIRFGVTLKDEQGEESPVVRHRRVAAHQIDESGVVACQAPATCKLLLFQMYGKGEMYTECSENMTRNSQRTMAVSGCGKFKWYFFIYNESFGLIAIGNDFHTHKKNFYHSKIYKLKKGGSFP